MTRPERDARRWHQPFRLAPDRAGKKTDLTPFHNEPWYVDGITEDLTLVFIIQRFANDPSDGPSSDPISQLSISWDNPPTFHPATLGDEDIWVVFIHHG